MAKLLIMVCAAAFAIGAAHAITYTVGSGDTQTATGVTHSERVEKLGDGTLVFTGNNSLSTLKFADVTAMNQEAKGSFYKIIDAPNGITGTFRLAADWPSGWSLKYSSDGKIVYVHYPKGTKIIVR